MYFFFPETKGVSLEEMDEIFGGVNHVREQENKDGQLNLNDEKGAVKENPDISDNLQTV